MSPTRRQVLCGTLPVTVGLAGCVGVDDTDRDTGIDSDPDRAPAESSGTERNPDVHKPRNLDDESVIADVETDGRSPTRRLLVGSREQADSIEFAAGVPDEDVASTREFLAATDFSEATIYATEVGIESCYRYRIESVSWEPGRVEYEYCQELRPSDARCEADARERVALFFRLPAVVEMDVTGAGASGRSPCRNRDTDYETIEANGSVESTEVNESAESSETNDSTENASAGSNALSREAGR